MSEDKAIDGEFLIRVLADQSGHSLNEAAEKRIPESIPEPEFGKVAFFKSLPEKGVILDVGCGNNSPYYTKEFLPQWYYIGLDVGDYNQEYPDRADEYILTTGEGFAGEILKKEGQVDAVVSSHNLEHCDMRQEVVRNMARSLKKGGRIYLSFPCEDSVNFPNRGGCLNYYDDCTHQGSPPDFGEVIALLYTEKVKIKYASTRFQPPLGWLLGLQSEMESAQNKQTGHGTWWLWGFETVIWGEKIG